MKARIVIDVELVEGCERDAVEIAEQAAAQLLLHRDHRVVDAEAVAAQRE